MNLFYLIPLTAFFINGFVWTYIFAQKSSSGINRAYLIYAANLAFWLLYAITMRSPVSENYIPALMDIGSIFWIPAAFWFLNFTYIFINKPFDTAYYIFAASSAVMILVSLFSDAVISGYRFTGWGIDETAGFLFIPTVFGVIFLPGVYALFLIKREIENTEDINLKHALPLVFYGSAIILIAGIMSNVVLPYLMEEDVIQLGETITVIQSLFIFRAVRKYSLFKVGIEEAAHGLFDTMKDAVIITDNNGRIIQLNREAGELFGSLKPGEKKHISALLGEYSFRSNFKDYEIKLSPLGEEKILSVTQSGILSEGIEKGKLLIIRDITERKRNEEIINKSKRMLAHAEQLAHLGSWEWSLNEDKVVWSEELYKIYGIEPHQFGGNLASFLGLLLPEDREKVQRSVQEAVLKKQPFRHYERIKRPDGEVRILFTKGSINFDADGNPYSMFGSCLDVTDFKKVEEELRNSREELRLLSASLQSAREEERKHIAREIHDELGQVLTAVKMDLVLLTEAVEEGGIKEAHQVIPEIKPVIGLVDKLIDTVRDISTELRPDILDHLGLLAAIEWQSREFEKRTGIRSSFETGIPYADFKPEAATAVFRIYQEALTNIIRHAACTEVKTFVGREDGQFILIVEDNGKGITDQEIGNIRSIGIVGMKERGFILGGTIDITGKAAAGTRVTLKVPLPKHEVELNKLNLEKAGI